MGKWVLYTQPNYTHPKSTQTHPLDTPKWRGEEGGVEGSKVVLAKNELILC